MAHLDERALAEEIESLRDEVSAAYKRLDERWSLVAKQLSELPIPNDVAYLFSEDQHAPEQHACLEWRKWNGKRRLCIATYCSYDPDENGDVTPYEEWSGSQRVGMLQYIPNLFKQALDSTKRFIEISKEGSNP